jgi:GNAT superfamily N-acetyltransferase
MTTTTMTQVRDITVDENGHLSNRWAIVADGTVVAELLADVDTDEISLVWVDDEHRGQGHAAHLYATAIAERVIFHAPVTHRTDDGNRWAIAVGGPSLPDCDTCCAHMYEEEELEEY